MFQSFDDVSDSTDSAERIRELRARLSKAGFDGFIVPRADEHQGEYVPERAERLRWLTGFSGSAGLAIILMDLAAIFVDGRYTIQAAEQVDTGILAPKHLVDEPPAKWISDTLKKGQVLGYNPWLLTVAQVERFRSAAEKAGAELKPMEDNPIDAIWTDQPAPPAAEIFAHPLQFAGRSSADKLSDVAEKLKEHGADAVVLTLPDSIAWLFNIRGNDVGHNPVPLAFAIATKDARATVFIDPERVPEDVQAMLSDHVDIKPPSALPTALEQLGTDKAAVLLDNTWTADAIHTALTCAGATIKSGQDPCILPKATKNAAELEGARAAHRRDAVAMCRFLAWLDRKAPDGSLDEIAVAKKLEQFRADTGELRDISFDTISAAGPHAAIPHYRVSAASNRALVSGEIYLVDSGAQYIDGTTDITRTVIIGEPTPEMRDRFTRVLKGMIALSRARFPAGTTGGNLDALARQALWTAGLDFDHGTGHGVGSYLSVHEGPARFSRADTTKLKAGMILSNEPGYYKQDEYGIRIENLVIVREPEEIAGGDRPMHWLETLTFCPIDRRLIEVELLTAEERDWLNDYHQTVWNEVSPALEGETLDWLKHATRGL